MTDAPRAATPQSIYIALLLVAFAAATPFIGAAVDPGDDSVILGPFVAWVLAGAGAGFLGILCTTVGAWRGPRSAITKLAIVLSGLLVVAVVVLLSLLLR